MPIYCLKGAFLTFFNKLDQSGTQRFNRGFELTKQLQSADQTIWKVLNFLGILRTQKRVHGLWIIVHGNYPVRL